MTGNKLTKNQSEQKQDKSEGLKNKQRIKIKISKNKGY